MNISKAKSLNKNTISWVWISGILFLVCFFGSAVLIFWGNEFERLGLTGSIYYILLIPLGFSSAAFLAGAMKSYASFKSNETLPYGKLNLSGPIVIFALVVGGGFVLPGLNTKEKFDFKIHIECAENGSKIINTGSVILYIGKYTRQENIHNSEVIFPDIPEGYNNKKGSVRLQLDNYQLAYPIEIRISKSGDSVFTIPIVSTKQSVSTVVRGTILNKKKFAVKNAMINFSSGLATCFSDENGDFSLTVPLPPGQSVPLKIIINGVTVFDQDQIISPSVPINLIL